jgi:hypothetical protein
MTGIEIENEIACLEAEWAGRVKGFWYGFAAGAFGVMLALAVTWMIYGGNQ